MVLPAWTSMQAKPFNVLLFSVLRFTGSVIGLHRLG